MTLPEFPGCFVCGKDNPRGLHIPFEIEENGVRAIFTPDRTLAGYNDMVHGGIISSLIDEAVVWAAYVATGRFGATAELNVRFKKPLTTGIECIIIGRMTEDKGKIWILEASVADKDGDPFAVGTGKVIPIKKSDL
jgi:uncharacterized protein (TIGR00369 family)